MHTSLLLEYDRQSIIDRIEKFSEKAADYTAKGDHDRAIEYQQRIQKLQKRLSNMNPNDRKYQRGTIK